LLKQPPRLVNQIRGLYYGWPMLFAVAIAQITSWGVLYYAFTVFLDPMQREFGWSIATLTGAYSLALLVSGFAAIPVGRWLDRYGPRVMMTAGSVFATLLVIAWATVDSLIVFYLVWVGIGLAMSTVLYEPAFVIVAKWFQRLRSRALTMLTFVAGFASVIYIPMSGWLVNSYDWRTALWIMAVLMAIGTIPIHAFVLRRSPGEIGEQPDGEPVQTDESRAWAGAQVAPTARPTLTLRDALGQRVFWWTAVAFVLANFSTLAIFVHLVPFLIAEGFSAGFAASMAGIAGIMALPGRLVFTPLGDYIRRQYVAAMIFGLIATGLAILLILDSRLGVIVFVVVFGMGFGAITPARAAIVADLYGATNYGAISGALATGITFARAAAPVTAGLIVTLTGGYVPVFLMLLIACILAVFAVLRTVRQ
jgi:MFS family permease